MTRSDQPEPSAVAIVHQDGLSSATSRASVADTPASRQIWWTQVVDGRPQVRLHSCEGRSPSLVLAQIWRIEFAGTSLRRLATWPKRPSLRLRTMYETSNRPVRCKTSSLETKSSQLMCRMRRWQCKWKEPSFFSNRLIWGSRSRSHRVVKVTHMLSVCGASWKYWACSDSRHSPVSPLRWLQVQCGYIPVQSCCDSTVCCPGI